MAKTASHVAEFAIPASSYLVKGAVKVIDLGADLTKGGWRGLVDALTPGPIRPNALPGITGVATEAPHTPLPSKTPVSSSLGLEGAPPVHGSTAPGGGHVPDGSAPHGGSDGPGEVPGRGGESEGSLGGHGDGRGNTDTSTDAKNPEHGDAEGNISDEGGADTNVDAHGAHTEPHRCDLEWRVGPGDEVPSELSDLSGKRAEAIAEAQAASEAFDNQFGAFNEALRDAGMPEMTRGQFTSGNIDATARVYRKKLADYPDLSDHFDELRKAANERRKALKTQTDIGEKFGEAAGRIAAKLDGLHTVMEEGSPGRGSVDQAFKTPDNSELVIQEVKGPSAQLGTAKVPGPDGGTVAATQGSDAYLRWVLRLDTQLRDKILADSALLHGLLEGTTKLRYRLVQPDETGHVRVAEFIIDQSKLDLRGWLEGP